MILYCLASNGYDKGKYVWFVDSDDYITEDALESLERILSKHSNQHK